ncbi:MAG: VOC family protein [Opitutales bacterium]|nr:VOC family protein [Opitutales bacterium]
MNPKIDLISIFVADMERMVSFYSDVIGFKVKRYSPGRPYASFDAGTIRLALYERAKLGELFSVPVQFPGDVNGSFAVAVSYRSTQHLEEEVKRIVEAGARPMHAIRDEPWGVRSLSVANVSSL